jgi:hypothetical protein
LSFHFVPASAVSDLEEVFKYWPQNLERYPKFTIPYVKLKRIVKLSL